MMMMMHANNFGPGEAEARGSSFSDQPKLHSKPLSHKEQQEQQKSNA
jgi:hypothetical protein